MQAPRCGDGARLVGERGSMLVVALLVLLGLSGVGLVMVQKVNDEIHYIGNIRRGVMAYHITESGAYTALAYADRLGPTGFISAVELSRPDPSQPAEWSPDDLIGGGQYFDMSAAGSFGFEGYVESTDTAAPVSAPPMDFRVRVTSSGMLQPIVGYAVSGPGSRCRFKYQFDTDGNVGDTSSTDDTVFSAWKRIRALMYIGPLPCDRTAGALGTAS